MTVDRLMRIAQKNHVTVSSFCLEKRNEVK